MAEDEEVREPTTSEKAHLILGVIIGAIFMALAVMTVYSDTVSNSGSEVFFEQLNMSHRDIALHTETGDRIDCTVSRFDEVQISRSSYVYRNASCSSWIQVNGSTVTVPVEADVLFNGGDNLSVGFDFPEKYVVCDVSEDMEEKTGEDSYVYNGAECDSYSGSLYEEWNDPEFENFNVHERGKELLENESSS